MKQLALGVRLRIDAVFDSFEPGPNVEVLAALRDPQARPLWLWGAPGSGKTHLLQAACAAADATADATAEAAADAAAAGAAYLPLRPPALPAAALAGFERCRLLCIDDVEAVAGELDWERALFRLFNDAAELGTRLVFAAAAAPRAIDWCLGDWRSRAAACVVYHVREPDEADRIKALQRHAAQRGLDLPPETSDYLLRRMPRDLRSLFGILELLDEASLVAQRPLTVPFIREALEKLGETKP